MNRQIPAAAFSLSLFLVVAGCEVSEPPPEAAPGEVHNQLSPEERAAGWILLFDGKSLQGWEDPAAETPPGHAWVVEDGCIKGIENPTLREDLFTTGRFRDFELVFEWKISEGGNSGVKYLIQDRALLVEGKTDPGAERFEDTVDYELRNRTADRSAIEPSDVIEEYTIAFEYQIIDNARHPDAQESMDRRAGAIYGLEAAAEAEPLPVGQFNRSRIRLQGNRVEHWLNGQKLLSADLESESIRQGLERRWGADSPVYRLLTELPERQSPIALQHHNDAVWFRNIKIRELN